jgi:hypothetical protein
MHILRYDYKYISESIEMMMPWELDVEMSMIADSINKEIAARNKSM